MLEGGVLSVLHSRSICSLWRYMKKKKTSISSFYYFKNTPEAKKSFAFVDGGVCVCVPVFYEHRNGFQNGQ